jgi:hypothetical protein
MCFEYFRRMKQAMHRRLNVVEGSGSLKEFANKGSWNSQL